MEPRPYAETYRILVLSVDHAVNKIDELWQQMSCRGVVRTG